MPEHIRGFRLFLLSIGISLAAFIVSLDAMIVNVALPTISGELGVREDVGAWIITVFTMSSCLFVPFSGWLSVRYGSVTLFIVATFVFSTASLFCGMIHSFNALFYLRIVQGAAGGTLIPLSFALILSSFPPEKRGVAVGFWSFFVMVGPAMGPMVGGWLSDDHWPWLFYLNVPLGIISALTVFVILRKHKQEKKHLHFDWIGLSLLFISIGSLQIALNRGEIDDWFTSTRITTLFIIALITFVFFIVWEIFHENPFVNLNHFRRRNFTLGCTTTAIAMGLLFSSFVLDSLWVQSSLGYTPFWAGLTLTPVGLFPLLFYPIMGRFVGYLDIRVWLSISFLLYACTFFWLSNINPYVSFTYIALPRLIQGIGFAILTVPNALAAIQGVAEESIIFAVSLFSFARMLLVGFSIPLALYLWERREIFYQSRLVERTVAGSPIFEDFLAPFRTLDVTNLQTDALGSNLINIHAATRGLADIYYLYGWLFLGLFCMVFLYKIPKRKSVTTS